MESDAESRRQDDENPPADSAADRTAERASHKSPESARVEEPPAAQPSSEETTSTAPHGDVIPQRAAEDDPKSWNDEVGNHDEWLKEQKPPHWS